MFGQKSTGVLTQSQKREKQALLNANQEFYMCNSFISKIEPKIVKITLHHLD